MIMFKSLLVSLNIEAILGEMTIVQRMKLDEIAQGDVLSDAYTATLIPLKAKRYKLAHRLRVLM